MSLACANTTPTARRTPNPEQASPEGYFGPAGGFASLGRLGVRRNAFKSPTWCDGLRNHDPRQPLRFPAYGLWHAP